MADPMTDQMAATIRDKRITAHNPDVEAAVQAFTEEITDCVPHVSPVDIGEILLHTAAHFPTVLRILGETGSKGSHLTCNLLSACGQELYSGSDQ